MFKNNFAKLICSAFVFLLFVNGINSQTNKVKMVFIGNSITAGVYDYHKSDVNVSYATQFGKLMQGIYGDTLEILNAGVSGRTMTKHGTAPIWNEKIFDKALSFHPDICLIALGTNDSKSGLYNLVQNEFFNDYQSMIDTFTSINPNTLFIVCLPPPIFEGHPYSPNDPHNDTLLVKSTIPLIESIAEKNKLFEIDFHTPFVNSIQYFSDKLHPNEEGHKQMAKILFDMFIEKDIIHQSLQLKDAK
nr:GDSL-type esterase/lipase family protein [uncultured Carboxylicivirga sp.]